MTLDKGSLLYVQAIVCALALCIVFLVSAAVSVSGMVKDGSGNGVNNALVSISNGSSGMGDVRTGGDGGFRLSGIPDGRYNLFAAYGDARSDRMPITVAGIDLNGIEITLPGLPSGGATPTPGPAGGGQQPGQVMYGRTTYDQPPVIQINQSWKRAFRTEAVAFDAGSTYDPDGYIMAYTWDFGDGSMGEGSSVRHVYRDVGKYTVKLTAVDNAGLSRSAFVSVIVSGKPPVAVPGNDTNASVGESVQLSGAASYAPDGRIVKYEWSFGDGAFGEGANVSHVYGRPDKYEVALKVTDDIGSNATAFMFVNVTGTLLAPAPAAKPGNTQAIVLLAAAGIAVIAVMLIVRKRAK